MTDDFIELDHDSKYEILHESLSISDEQLLAISSLDVESARFLMEFNRFLEMEADALQEPSHPSHNVILAKTRINNFIDRMPETAKGILQGEITEVQAALREYDHGPTLSLALRQISHGIYRTATGATTGSTTATATANRIGTSHENMAAARGLSTRLARQIAYHHNHNNNRNNNHNDNHNDDDDNNNHTHNDSIITTATAVLSSPAAMSTTAAAESAGRTDFGELINDLLFPQYLDVVHRRRYVAGKIYGIRKNIRSIRQAIRNNSKFRGGKTKGAAATGTLSRQEDKLAFIRALEQYTILAGLATAYDKHIKQQIAHLMSELAELLPKGADVGAFLSGWTFVPDLIDVEIESFKNNDNDGDDLCSTTTKKKKIPCQHLQQQQQQQQQQLQTIYKLPRGHDTFHLCISRNNYNNNTNTNSNTIIEIGLFNSLIMCPCGGGGGGGGGMTAGEEPQIELMETGEREGDYVESIKNEPFKLTHISLANDLPPAAGGAARAMLDQYELFAWDMKHRLWTKRTINLLVTGSRFSPPKTETNGTTTPLL